MRYFDDIEVQVPELIGHYDLRAEEMIEFARRWDPQPFHTDPEAAAKSMFGGLTASSLHLFAICTRLFFDQPRPMAILAMLGKDQVRFPAPGRPGDRLSYRTQCIDKRLSRSKPDRGIIVLADELQNASGTSLMTQHVTLLLATRSGRDHQHGLNSTE